MRDARSKSKRPKGRVAAKSPRKQGWGPDGCAGGAGRYAPSRLTKQERPLWIVINAFLFRCRLAGGRRAADTP